MTKLCPVCSVAYPESNAFCPLDGSVLRADAGAESLIGSVIAERYLVTELLGEGGMGTVYLARHVRLPQMAAIKILRPDLVRDPAAVARFNREASNASRIEEEHVARVFDYGETVDGLVYLAMEHVPGQPLRVIIEAEGPLAPRRTASLIRQVAAGLDAAHDLPQPLIHRDLKPDNILVVSGPNGRERAKVVDFGISKAMGADESGLTKTGFVVGTPDFMSPEQLLGEPIDARSDVYALALVSFQCLTGRLPFDMTTPERARLGRLVEPPRHLLDTHPGVSWPASLQTVFDDALARDRDRRPPSAGEFARRLTDAIDETWPADGSTAPHAARVTPVATAIPRTPLTRTPPSRAPLTVLVGAGLVAAVVGGTLLARGRDPAPDSAAPAALAAAPPALAPAPEPRVAPPPPSPPSASPRVPERRAPVAAAAPATSARAASDSVGALAVDSLVRALDAPSVAATQARGIADALRALLPRLGSGDQVRAQVGLVRASILTGDVAGACAAMRTATATARRPEQLAELRRLDAQLGCE